jgi:hypothetical protein
MGYLIFRFALPSAAEAPCWRFPAKLPCLPRPLVATSTAVAEDGMRVAIASYVHLRPGRYFAGLRGSAPGYRGCGIGEAGQVPSLLSVSFPGEERRS